MRNSSNLIITFSKGSFSICRDGPMSSKFQPFVNLNYVHLINYLVSFLDDDSYVHRYNAFCDLILLSSIFMFVLFSDNLKKILEQIPISETIVKKIIKTIYLNTQCYLSGKELEHTNSDKPDEIIDDIAVIKETLDKVNDENTVEKILNVYFGLIVADFTQDSEIENFIFDYR